MNVSLPCGRRRGGGDNLIRIERAVARMLEAGPAERVAGQVNRQWFGREAGIDPQCLRRGRNPKCAGAFEAYDKADRARWLAGVDARRIEADRKAETRAADDRKDELVLTLRAENARLRVELERFYSIRRLMAESGRLP